MGTVITLIICYFLKKSGSKARRDPTQWNMTLLRYRWLPVNCTLHLRHRRPSKTVAQTRINKQANAQNAASLSVMCNYGDIYRFETGGGNDFKFWAISIHRLSEAQPLSLPCQSRGRIKCWLQLVFSHSFSYKHSLTLLFFLFLFYGYSLTVNLLTLLQPLLKSPAVQYSAPWSESLLWRFLEGNARNQAKIFLNPRLCRSSWQQLSDFGGVFFFFFLLVGDLEIDVFTTLSTGYNHWTNVSESGCKCCHRPHNCKAGWAWI